MSDTLNNAIKKTYGGVAESTLSDRDAGVRAVAEAFGYTAAELTSIPAGANMGLSCGNPTATAGLRPGETVVDLGSGGGLDVFLAAQKVGPTGRAIGIDMTAAMIDRARKNAERGPDGRPYTNIEFHLANMDHLPLADASVDCVISNCVINLATDKSAVFREIARVLKPGGRVAVSDIALKAPLPKELAENVAAWAGCIAGAISIRDYVAGLEAAGLVSVTVVDAHADLNAYSMVEGQSACCSPVTTSTTLPIAGAACCPPASPPAPPALHEQLAALLKRFDVNQYAASVKVYALKPAICSG